MGLAEDWDKVVPQALGSLIPVYDRMNSVMSMGKDRRWRETGIRLAVREDDFVLDAGCGPGVMTEEATAIYKSLRPLLYDSLYTMLEAARSRVASVSSGSVRGVFESMPFSSDVFDTVMMGYSFRDARDMRAALAEISRVLRDGGRLLIVDIAKPDSRAIRLSIGFYWRVVVPFLALLVAGKYWRKYSVLYITYKRLPTNSQLKALVAEYFEKVTVHTQMLGGSIILVAEGPRKQ